MTDRRRRPHTSHRRALLLSAPGLVLGAHAWSATLAPTPHQGEGPFYPRRLPADRDADLTSVDGRSTPGEVIEMVGRVVDVRGAPIPQATVEIWHCDPNGVYAHVGFATDPTFQGYGAVIAGPDGGYRFRTVRPGLYPGRTRHIHVKAHMPGRGVDGRAALTTQMYFPDEPGNPRDGLLRRVATAAALIAREQPGPPPRYVFDIILS